MRNLILILLAGVFFLPGAVTAFESIKSYDVKITINDDSSIDVVERIEYDFGSDLKRGIFRDISRTYDSGGSKYLLQVENVRVTDDSGEPYEFELKSNTNRVSVIIGGSVPKVTGVTPYVISYRVQGALEYYGSYDELYWNVIGDDWNVTIENASAEIILPEGLLIDDITADCYMGLYGSTDKCSSSDIIFVDSSTDGVDGDVVDRYLAGIEFSHHYLGNGKGMTVQITFPKGYATEAERIPLTFPWYYYVFPITVTLLFIYGIIRAFAQGGDPKGRDVIVREYDPPKNIVPGEVGIIMKKVFSNKDFASQLVWLAVQDYIRIVFVRVPVMKIFSVDGFLFLKIKDTSSLSEADKKIIESIFDQKFRLSETEATTSVMKSSSLDKDDIFKDIQSSLVIASSNKMIRAFHEYLPIIEKAFEASTLQKNIFKESFSNSTKAGGWLFLKTYGPLLVLGIIGFLLIVRNFGPVIDSAPAVLTIVFLIGVVVLYPILFLFLMSRVPSRTIDGVVVRDHLKGLKEYIETAEKERLDFHFDPRANADLFEKLLPYAIALGVEKKWAKHFSELEYKPGWYKGTTGSAFAANGMDAFVKNLSAFTATSGGSGSRGGGGSSGGGCGGGGGGSR